MGIVPGSTWELSLVQPENYPVFLCRRNNDYAFVDPGYDPKDNDDDSKM